MEKIVSEIRKPQPKLSELSTGDIFKIPNTGFGFGIYMKLAEDYDLVAHSHDFDTASCVIIGPTERMGEVMEIASDTTVIPCISIAITVEV